MCIAIKCLTMHTPCGHQTADCTPSCSPWIPCKAVKEVRTRPEYAEYHCSVPTKTREDTYDDAKHTSVVYCDECSAKMARSRETLVVPESLGEMDSAPQAAEGEVEGAASESESSTEYEDDATEEEVATLRLAQMEEELDEEVEEVSRNDMEVPELPAWHKVIPTGWQWNAMVVPVEEYDNPDPMDLDQPGWQEREGVSVSSSKRKRRSFPSRVEKPPRPARKKSVSARPASIVANTRPRNWRDWVQVVVRHLRMEVRKKEGAGGKKEKKKKRGLWPWKRQVGTEDEMICD